jgi:hypothetical protein
MNTNLPSDAPSRITMRSIFNILLEQFHLEKGIGYTIKRWVLSPRQAAEEYLLEDRKRMIKPFRFVLLTVAIATFLSFQFMPIGEDLVAEMKADPNWAQIPDFLKPFIEQSSIITKKYFNLLFLSSIPFVSLASYWIFKEIQYNYAEHLVINSYLFSIQTIVYIFTIPFMTDHAWIAVSQALIIAGYTLYAYIKIFKQPFFAGLGKSILVWLLSQVMAAIASVLILGISLLI